jgi:hypothetical protein
MQTRKTKAVQKASPASNNAEVIQAAVACVQAFAAARAGYEGAPDGHSETAEKSDERWTSKARKALKKLSVTPATSATALAAKARIVPIVYQETCEDGTDLGGEFYRSFAADVRAFLEKPVRQEYEAKIQFRRPEAA